MLLSFSSVANTPYRSKIYSCKEQMSTRSLNNHLIRDPRAARRSGPGRPAPRQAHAALTALLLAPRESNLYAETKRLVDTGLAEAREGVERRPQADRLLDHRPRTRGAARWLATPPAPARVESEAQLRLLYANYGSKDNLLATIQSIEDDAQSTIDHYAQLLTEYARGDGLFPDRIHVNALLGSLSIEQARATVRWAQRSRGAVEAWETPAARHRMGRQNDAARCA